MWRRVLTVSGVLALVIGLVGSSGLSAQQKPLGEYDPRTLAVVVNRDSSDVAIIDTATDTVVGRIPLDRSANAHMAMLSHDGRKLLVSATGRDRFLVVDLATGTIEKTVTTGRSPEHFDLAPDGRLAFVGNIQDSTVSVIDVREGREIKRVTGFFEPHGFSVLPDGSKVYIASIGAHEVAVLDAAGAMRQRVAVGGVGRVAARDPQRHLAAIKGVVHPTLSRDGAFAYAASGDAGEVAVIDTRTDRVVKTLRVGEQPWRAYGSPDGLWMLVPNNGDATISVISTATQNVVATLTAGPEMTGINFAAGGAKAYAISRGDSAVYVYEMKTFRLVTRLKIGAGLSLETAATTADGTKIYLASSTDDALYVIDARTDRVSRIANVGRYPWGVSILGSASGNYCH